MDLRLGARAFRPGEVALMAIINRTPDSFFDRGATFGEAEALDAVDRAVADGADVVDIGGVKAAPGVDVDPAEETRRVASFVGTVRDRYPDLVLSVDTYRAEVGRAVAAEGADVLNDAWGGTDQALADVAAEHGLGLVCTHAGHLPPRTRPHRVAYDDVVTDVLRTTTGLAERAVGVGVRRDGILIDPGHDFGKNTRQSLELTRRLAEMTATDWPVLVAMSNKDFLGEALDLELGERLEATLAVTAVAVWLGARMVRTHAVRPARRVIDTVRTVRGDVEPRISRRGLA